MFKTTNYWRSCVPRLQRHGQTHAVFARTLRQILTRVGRVVERIVPLHHAERRGKCNGQSFARMFL